MTGSPLLYFTGILREERLFLLRDPFMLSDGKISRVDWRAVSEQLGVAKGSWHFDALAEYVIEPSLFAGVARLFAALQSKDYPLLRDQVNSIKSIRRPQAAE